MKKILLFVVTSLCLFFVSCNDKDKEEFAILLTPQELIQTTWDVELNRYAENGEVEHKEYGIIEFNSAVEGVYINGEGSGDPATVSALYYQIDKRKITFKNSALVGTWTLIEKFPKQIILT
ncbi:hypothetical protein [Bacteroides pyogenes]|uniref:hypothetical protein n=1 Tax=Bacteroides pyogenes TaxID=310300 RepID=UPI003F9FE85C